MDAIPKFRLIHYQELAFNEMVRGIVDQTTADKRSG
jgi:hypothetical protein